MMEIVLKVKVDEFLARKIENIVKKGAFKSEGEFLRSAGRYGGKMGNLGVKHENG